MALGDNSNLFTTADKVDIENNNTNDEIQNTAGATAFTFSDGKTGDDSLVGFSKNDSIVNYQKIFDGNNDGIINFGANGILDIDRTSPSKAGADQITLQPFEGGVKNLRYLGNKEGTSFHVYADAATLWDLDATTTKLVTESKVSNDTFDASKGDNVFLYDTALGLNLGGDKITGFSFGDELVTTTKIHNGADAGALITFGNNGVLDLPGDTDGVKGDVGTTQGGQIDFGASLTLSLLSTDVNANGVTYYHYGLAPVAV